MNDLGEILKKLRGTNSLREASKKIGVSHTYLSTIERGLDTRTGKPVKPTPEILKLIANAYSYPYEDLLTVAGYLNERQYNSTYHITEEELIHKYKLIVDGVTASQEEIKEAIRYIKILRHMKSD